jgi:hypothetical protein
VAVPVAEVIMALVTLEVLAVEVVEPVDLVVAHQDILALANKVSQVVLEEAHQHGMEAAEVVPVSKELVQALVVMVYVLIGFHPHMVANHHLHTTTIQTQIIILSTTKLHLANTKMVV